MVKYFEQDRLNIFEVKVEDGLFSAGVSFGELGEIKDSITIEDNEFGIFEGEFFPELSILLR